MGKIDKEKLLKEIKLKSDDVDVTWVCSFIKNFPEEPEIDFDVLYKEYSGSVQLDSTQSAWGFRDFLKSKNLTAPKPVEIDFDALYNEWSENTMVWSESRSPYDQARSFRDFLKSKKLTAQKPVEIPVKCPSCGCLSFKIDESMMCSACGTVFELTRKLEIPVKRTWTLKKECQEAFKNFDFSFNRVLSFESEPAARRIKYYDLHEEPDYSKIPKGSIVVVSTKDGKIKSAEDVDHFDSNKIYCKGGVSYELKYVKILIAELAKE